MMTPKQTRYFEAKRRFCVAREARREAVAALRRAAREHAEADKAAGPLALVQIHDGLAAAMQRVTEANRTLLFAASDLDDAALDAAMSAVERV